MSMLSFRSATRDGYSGTATGSRIFLDFLVDGASLYRLIRAQSESRLDQISALWLAPRLKDDVRTNVIAQLTGQQQGDASDGRVSIYVCPECGRLGCGAVTVHLEVRDERVHWSGWRYENDYDDRSAFNLGFLPEASFERAAYTDALTWVDEQMQLEYSEDALLGIAGP